MFHNLNQLAVSASSGQFTPPSIEEFLPPPIAFEGTLFEFNRLQLVQWFALLCIVVIFSVFTAKAKLVPSRFQSVVEMLLLFVQKNIAEEVIGKTLGRKYAPLIAVIFVTVLFMDLTGVVPGLNIAGSAQVALPIVLAIIAYIGFIYAGIKEAGLGPFLKSSLFPPGVPAVVYILLTPIEFVSNFIIRPFTLIIRLLANMVAGHFLMALCLLATNFFILYGVEITDKGIGIFTFVMTLLVICFEIFVACLQAYIFAILTAVYINLSVHSH